MPEVNPIFTPNNPSAPIKAEDNEIIEEDKRKKPSQSSIAVNPYSLFFSSESVKTHLDTKFTDRVLNSNNCIQGCHRQENFQNDPWMSIAQRNPSANQEKIAAKKDDLKIDDLKAEIERIAKAEDIPSLKVSDRFSSKEDLLKDNIDREKLKPGAAEVLNDKVLKSTQDIERHTKNFRAMVPEFSRNGERSYDPYLAARNAERVAEVLTEIRDVAKGKDQVILDLAREKLAAVEKNIKDHDNSYQQPLPYTDQNYSIKYALQGLIGGSFDEKKLHEQQEELKKLETQKQNLSLDDLTQSVSLTTSSDSKISKELLADRALANLTNDPKSLLKYFPVLEAKVTQGKISAEDLASQIKDLASRVQGGYIGKGEKFSEKNIPTIASKFDQSTKFLIAASWFATRPDDQFAMKLNDDKASLPKVLSINGPFKSGKSFLDGFVSTAHDHVFMQSFGNYDDINTSIHEFIHKRDRLSDSQSSSPFDGYMNNSAQVSGLIQYRQIFGEKISSDLIDSREIFGMGKEVVGKSPAELVARTDTEFLLGSIEFRHHASELKLPGHDLSFYDSLVAYYGVDPLKKTD